MNFATTYVPHVPGNRFIPAHPWACTTGCLQNAHWPFIIAYCLPMESETRWFSNRHISVAKESLSSKIIGWITCHHSSKFIEFFLQYLTVGGVNICIGENLIDISSEEAIVTIWATYRKNHTYYTKAHLNHWDELVVKLLLERHRQDVTASSRSTLENLPTRYFQICRALNLVFESAILTDDISSAQRIRTLYPTFRYDTGEFLKLIGESSQSRVTFFNTFKDLCNGPITSQSAIQFINSSANEDNANVVFAAWPLTQYCLDHLSVECNVRWGKIEPWIARIICNAWPIFVRENLRKFFNCALAMGNGPLVEFYSNNYRARLVEAIVPEIFPDFCKADKKREVMLLAKYDLVSFEALKIAASGDYFTMTTLHVLCEYASPDLSDHLTKFYDLSHYAKLSGLIRSDSDLQHKSKRQKL